MICDFCKNNEASIHLIKVTNNTVEKINLCMNCVKNYSFFSSEDFFGDLTKVLSKFFEIDIKISNKDDGDRLFESVSIDDNKKCSFCNIDLNTIKSIGRVGCANCYTEFRDVLNPIVKTIHDSLEHKGRVPVKSSNDVKIEKEIRDLKYQLKEEVTVENFEVAAKLRDTIKKLQKKLYIGKNVN